MLANKLASRLCDLSPGITAQGATLSEANGESKDPTSRRISALANWDTTSLNQPVIPPRITTGLRISWWCGAAASPALIPQTTAVIFGLACVPSCRPRGAL
jgi:hypothetical protein